MFCSIFRHVGFVAPALLSQFDAIWLGGIVRTPCQDAALVLSLTIALASACRRAQGPVFEGGGEVGSACPGNPGPPDAGLVWLPGVAASATPPQATGWLAVSTDAECAAIKPAN